MNIKSKRATAATVTLSNAARQGGSDHPTDMEMTMTSHIMQAVPGAIMVRIEEDRTRPLNPGEPLKFTTTMDDQLVVSRSAVPMYDSCRVLASWGFPGKVAFVHQDGAVGMTMDIEAGAKLTVREGPHGPRVPKYVESLSKPVASGSNADAAAIEAVEA